MENVKIMLDLLIFMFTIEIGLIGYIVYKMEKKS